VFVSINFGISGDFIFGFSLVTSKICLEVFP